VRAATAARLLRDVPGPAVTTWPVIGEALHLLGRAAARRGSDPWYGQEPLARRVLEGGLLVADFTALLGARSLALMAQYADVPMDLGDASLVALAEAGRDLRIVTFDADFRMYRTQAGAPLVILESSTARPERPCGVVRTNPHRPRCAVRSYQWCARRGAGSNAFSNTACIVIWPDSDSGPRGFGPLVESAAIATATRMRARGAHGR
jgi:predicted nucleic acid-binding protein